MSLEKSDSHRFLTGNTRNGIRRLLHPAHLGGAGAKSCNSLTHRSCTDLGHDVLSVGCVVLKTRSWGDRGVVGSSEGLPANVFHWWFLSLLADATELM